MKTSEDWKDGRLEALRVRLKALKAVIDLERLRSLAAVEPNKDLNVRRMPCTDPTKPLSTAFHSAEGPGALKAVGRQWPFVGVNDDRWRF